MTLIFFNEDFDKILYNNVLTEQYPLLNTNDKDILFKYLKKVILCLGMVYNFDSDVEGFTHELTQNDYQDSKWLTTMLFEYTTSPDQITSFYDFYKQKNKYIKELE